MFEVPLDTPAPSPTSAPTPSPTSVPALPAPDFHRFNHGVALGNRLEKLAGSRAGQYSIRVNDQWRICFTWSTSGAGNVQLVDHY